MKHKKRGLVDLETGELYDELGEDDRILKGASVKHLSNQLSKNPDTVKRFFKGNAKEIEMVMHELDVYERAFMFSVAPYVSFDDCCLKFYNNVDITTADLIAITNISRSKLFEVTESLRHKDLIYKGMNSKNRQYYMNPWIYCKGNKLDKSLKNMFRNYRIRSLGGIKWENLSD